MTYQSREVTGVKEKNINHPEEAFVEIDPSGDEFSVGQFENRERLDSDQVVFGGVKQLEGRELTEDDTWTFTIEGVPEEGETEFTGPLPDPTTAANRKGTFTFAPIVFSANHLGECYFTDDGSYHCASKVYTYRVVESGEVTGVTNDEPKTFTVTVSLDENGDVQAEADPADLGELVTFTNKYESAADIQFIARKNLRGGTLAAGQFSFVLTLPDGTTETVSNDKKGWVIFSRISYTLDDAGQTYTYTVQEVIPANPNPDITYDETVHTITVSLENDGYGNLVQTVTLDGKEVSAKNGQINVGRFINKQTGEKERIVRTGFSAGSPTILPDMPLDLSYKPMPMTLQIPTLELTTEIVQVPEVDGEYPVTWLGDKAGLLENFGEPDDGRMFLAGHNHLSNTEAGPFAFLVWMEEGDRIFINDQNNGLQLYTVYANEKIDEDDFDSLDRISQQYENSITLITCEDEYEPGYYLSRRIIAARPLNN